MKKRNLVTNGIAKALMTPLYKLRVIQDKRGKQLIKSIKKYLREF